MEGVELGCFSPFRHISLFRLHKGIRVLVLERSSYKVPSSPHYYGNPPFNAGGL